MQTPKPKKLKPGRKSTVATHPRCVEIELACASGTSLRKVAATFAVSRAAVDRHWHGLSAEHRAELAAVAADLAQYEARIRAHFASLHARAVRQRGAGAPAKPRIASRAHAA